jgi:hypothetical protein
LFATEFPFAILTRELVEGKDVLTIAGSGDLPLHFAAQDARSVLALDISAPACAFCSLKFAAVKEFDYHDFLWFFLAGIERAQLFLEDKGVNVTFNHHRWRGLYEDLRNKNPTLPSGEWEDRQKQGFHPFAAGLHHTELWFLPQIPYLVNETMFQAVKRCVDKIRLFQDDIGNYLRQQKKRWHLIYLSNVPEYIRSNGVFHDQSEKWREDLEAIFQQADKNISSRGEICWYVFHNPSKPDECLEFCERFVCRLKFQVTRKTITYWSDFFKSSRFTNGLITACKKRKRT